MIRALPLLLLLAACGGGERPRAEPIVITKEVVVSVTISCVPDTLKGSPVYVDTDAALVAAINAAVRYQLMSAGRDQRVARLGEVEPIVAGCLKAK